MMMLLPLTHPRLMEKKEYLIFTGHSHFIKQTKSLKSEQQNKTCEWLLSQSEGKKKIICSRKHNRREGFPSTSARPVACGAFM
jgi:hypothetical protein